MTSSYVSKNIEALRDKFELTQEQLGERVGVSKTTVHNWEHGTPLRKSNVKALREAFGLSEHDLFGYSDGLYAKMHGLTNIREAAPSESYAPVVGVIAAGEPREAYEMTGEKLWIPPEIIERDPDSFYLLVGSDSMDETEYKQGVYAAISPNTPVKSGDIAAVKVNGDDAVLKVVKFYDDFVALEPRSTNPDYKRIIIDERDPDAPYFKVLGKAVWHYSPVEF